MSGRNNSSQDFNLTAMLDTNVTAATVLTTAVAAGLDPTDAVITDMEQLMPQAVWRVFEVLHILLTVVVLAANCLSLGVIYGVVSSLTPPLQLLTSLAFADMLAPWAIITMYFPKSTCQDEIHSALLLTAHNASALSLLALAFIHNIATFRPLQYEKIITQKRMWITINLVWMTALLTANVHFLATLTHHHSNTSYCEQVRDSLHISLVLATTLAATTALVTGIIYGRILLHLRPIQALTGENGEPRKSTKGVITGLLLVTSFLLGWLPFLITKFDHVAHVANPPESVLVALQACQVLILLNCLADPFIYGKRMTNMELGYLRLYHRVRGWVVLQWNRLRNRHDADELPSTPLNPIESIC